MVVWWEWDVLNGHLSCSNGVLVIEGHVAVVVVRRGHVHGAVVALPVVEKCPVSHPDVSS